MHQYIELWRIRALRNAQMLALLTRIPQFGTGVVLTLHVVGTLHGTYAQAGLVATVSALATAAAGPWRGRLLDRTGLRRTLAPSLVVVPLVWLAVPFAGYGTLLLLVAAGAVFTVPINVLVRQVTLAVTPPELQRAALSFDSVLIEICFMLGPAGGVLLAATIGSGVALPVLWIASTLGVVALVVVNPPLTPQEHAEHLPGRWLSVAAGTILLTTVVAGLIIGGTEVALVAAMNALGHAGAVGLMITIWSIGSAIGGFTYGARRGRVPGSPLLLLGAAVTTLPLALMSGPLSGAPLLALTGSLGAPLISATVAELSTLVPPARRGEALGAHQSAMLAGTALGPPVTGAIIDAFGWSAGFAGTGALGVLFAAVALVVRLSRGRRAGQP